MSTQLHTQRARCPSFSPCGGVLVAGGKPAAHVNTIDTQPTRQKAVWRSLLSCSPCSYPARGLGSATNSPELPKLPLSRKHRGQRTTNVTGTTPAMSLSALCFRHGMQKPLSGCGCSDFSCYQQEKRGIHPLSPPLSVVRDFSRRGCPFFIAPSLLLALVFPRCLPFVLPKTNHGLEPHPVLPSLGKRARIELALSFAM